MAIDLFSIGRFTVHGYGLMIGLGFVAAVLLASWQAKKVGLSPDHLTSIAMWVLIIGFLGGKLLHIITNLRVFFQDPISLIGSEGFVVYGGIITGILSIYVYCRIKKIPFLEYIDIFATFVPLNQAFGRIGCFLAGCCYGMETDSWMGVVFPQGCLAPAGVKVLPTQLIMAAGDFIICLVVYLFSKKRRIPGTCAVVYLFMYSVGRFIIEFFRNDPRGNVGALSTSQFIAIIIAVLDGLLLCYLLKSNKNNTVNTVSYSETEDEVECEKETDNKVGV